MPATILPGDCLAILPTLADNSIDAIVTDPPYHLASQKQTAFANTTQMDTPHRRTQKGFMNTEWDGGDIAFRPDVWRECLRVLKPGGHMAVFGGSRTHHRVWCAIEDAGFEVRDTCMWLHAQGFPKSLDVSKAIDKHLGAEREIIGEVRRWGNAVGKGRGGQYANRYEPTVHGAERFDPVTTATTPEAQQWQGWGTALKPSHEPILLARKPLEGNTVAANVLERGTGGINVDACRVGTDIKLSRNNSGRGNAQTYNGGDWKKGTFGTGDAAGGRWPPNLLHDGSEEVVECFPQTAKGNFPSKQDAASWKMSSRGKGLSPAHPTDEGSAARFFPSLGYSDDERRVMYCPKASKRDRAGSKHPTVKPQSLMRWLCKLICPPGGVILDPFAGSGSTGEAASDLGMNSILIEREAEYVADIRKRLAMFIAP